MSLVTLLTRFYPAINGQRKRGYSAKPYVVNQKHQSETDSAFYGFDLHR